MIQAESVNDTTSFSEYISPYKAPKIDSFSFDKVIEETIELNTGKTFTQLKYEGNKINYETPSWILILLLFGYLSIAFIRAVYRKRFTMLFQTLINWKLSKQIIRYEKVYTHPVNVIMTINFLICFPLFFAIVRSEYFIQEDTIAFSFLLIAIPVIIYSILKVGLHQLTGWLWSEKSTIEEYLFQTNLFNKYLGLGFLILTTILIYSSISLKISLYFSLGIILLSIIFQLVRGIIIGLESGFKLYFIILYLCTLEILPWLGIGKWISNSL